MDNNAREFKYLMVKGVRVLFVTKSFFSESQSFVRYSSKYLNIQFIQHKIWDESVAHALNSGLEYFMLFGKYVSCS